MRRRRYDFDEAKVQRYIAEGRGQGVLSAYRPWLQIQDLASKGRSHRPYGIKTQRVHHLLSDGEWKCFLKFEADDDVVDIWEQFPLDRIQTYQIARKLGIKHPVTTDGTPYVLTIDFLVTKKTVNGHKRRPFTFKYAPNTLTVRDKQLLKIASEFWRSHGEELQLIDEKFFDENLAIKYDAIRACHDISQRVFSPGFNVRAIAALVLERVRVGGLQSLMVICRQIASQQGVNAKDVFDVAKHLISHKQMRIDLSSELELQDIPLNLIDLQSHRRLSSGAD